MKPSSKLGRPNRPGTRGGILCKDGTLPDHAYVLTENGIVNAAAVSEEEAKILEMYAYYSLLAEGHEVGEPHEYLLSPPAQPNRFDEFLDNLMTLTREDVAQSKFARNLRLSEQQINQLSEHIVSAFGMLAAIAHGATEPPADPRRCVC